MNNKIFLFPISLAVIFFASVIIIFSPVGKKNIIALPTPTPFQNYQCPAEDYVDCMPIVDPKRAYQCEKPYMDWAKINCPNFKGGAF